MYTVANRANRVFALPLDKDGDVRDLISGTAPSTSTGTWTASVGRFGDGAYLFDATSEYLAFANDSRFIFGDGTKDFHVGAWVKMTGVQAYPILCECDPVAAGRRFHFRVRNNGTQALFYMAPNYPSATPAALVAYGPSVTWTTGVWRYVCCQRVGDVYTVYVDGVAGTPVTYTASDFVLHATRPFYIGQNVGQSIGFSINGYIQGFEISAPGTLLDVYGGKRPIR